MTCYGLVCNDFINIFCKRFTIPEVDETTAIIVVSREDDLSGRLQVYSGIIPEAGDNINYTKILNGFNTNLDRMRIIGNASMVRNSSSKKCLMILPSSNAYILLSDRAVDIFRYEGDSVFKLKTLDWKDIEMKFLSNDVFHFGSQEALYYILIAALNDVGLSSKDLRLGDWDNNFAQRWIEGDLHAKLSKHCYLAGLSTKYYPSSPLYMKTCPVSGSYLGTGLLTIDDSDNSRMTVSQDCGCLYFTNHATDEYAFLNYHTDRPLTEDDFTEQVYGFIQAVWSLLGIDANFNEGHKVFITGRDGAEI